MSSLRTTAAVGAVCLQTVCATVAFAILPQLVPPLALRRAMRLSSVGLLFGLQALVMALGSAVAAPLLVRFGPRRCLGVSTAVAAVSGATLGLLQFCPAGLPFSLLAHAACLALGGCLGVQAASALATLVALCPDRAATMFGLMNFTSGFTFVVGPAVSGVLAERTAFCAPFFVFGGAALISVALILLIVPPGLDTRADEGEELESSPAAFRAFLPLFRRPAAATGATVYFAFMSSGGFMAATLSVALVKGFGVGATKVGLLFALNSVGVILAPVVSRVCDHLLVFRPFSVAGCLMLGVSLLLIAPPRAFHLGPPSLTLCCVGLALQGIGLGIFLPSMFGDLMQTVRGLRERRESAERLLMSSLIFLQAVGASVGALLGGLLHTTVGFPAAAAGYGLTECIVGLLWALFALHTCHRRRRIALSQDELEQLIDKEDGSDPDP